MKANCSTTIDNASNCAYAWTDNYTKLELYSQYKNDPLKRNAHSYTKRCAMSSANKRFGLHTEDPL